MGGEPWDYFVPFNASIEAALDKLRADVFASGRFYLSELKPATMDEAIENAAETGTRSILDIMSVGPEPDFCTVGPLSAEDLVRHFGTAEPTHEMIADNGDYFEDIQRGQGVYIVVFKDGRPAEYYFAGYSFD